jgi:DNA-binding transcriptional regulator/RsmH inhibitor MraZ
LETCGFFWKKGQRKMLSFCGLDNCTVDANGRIRLTQRVVEDFLREGNADVVMHGLPEGCIALYPESVWHRMRAADLNDPATMGGSFAMRSSMRRFGALTASENISRQGRITLPELLREHAHLGPGVDAVVVGVEIGVEIWEAGRFRQEMESAREREEMKREREFDRELNGI